MVGPNFRVGKKIGCGNFGELKLGKLRPRRLPLIRSSDFGFSCPQAKFFLVSFQVKICTPMSM